MIILWHIRSPLLTLIFIIVAFSPQTIRDSNALPDSLISSAEGAEDGVAKFILCRELGTSHPGPGPGE